MKLYHIHPLQAWKSKPPLMAHLPRLCLPRCAYPRFVRRCPVTLALCAHLRHLHWDQLPLTLAMQPPGERYVPLAAYLGAYLVKLEHALPSFSALRRFLRDHPALVWALGFPLIGQRRLSSRFEVEASLPCPRHFSKRLSQLPNEIVQTLLDGQVAWLKTRLGDEFGKVVSLDTKHILAWVKENNPKAFIKEGRFDPDQQPAGDPDCKLGCKRQRNQITPTKEGQAVTEKVSVGEYYWGYASGVVATKMAGVGEFVLAEMTQTFDCGDLTYFFPLMAQVEARLGGRPRFLTADAAFDAFYVYDYFHQPDQEGFAAVPLRQMKHQLSFDAEGLPLCEADLSMPLRGSYTNRTSLVQHQRGRYGCPLLHPEPNGERCPIDHPKWPEGGCKRVIPTAAGTRIRYQLDREAETYKHIYRQRTAVERIFSQATNLGIERPKLRNRQAIANLNTLIYVLINLRAMAALDG